jgi:hypothetical protein
MATAVAGEWHWDPCLAMGRRWTADHNHPRYSAGQTAHTDTAKQCEGHVFGHRKVGYYQCRVVV